jgi:hypothetical protein
MEEKASIKNILNKLRENDISALEDFNLFQKAEMDIYTKIELTHEILDLMSFKLKQSKCLMDKEALADYILNVFKKTINTYEYNPKFIASQFKALITFHRNNKDYDKAIGALELLVYYGITDDDSQRFHIQLDDLYRQRKKYQEKLERNGDVQR